MREAMLGTSPSANCSCRPCSAHLPYNDQPSMDAYTESELDTFGLLQTLIQVSHGIENP